MLTIATSQNILKIKKWYYYTVSILVCALFILTSRLTHAAEMIDVMTYHKDAPFLIGEKASKGLSIDLIDYLNQKGADRFQFQLIALPRNRLNLYIERGFPGVIPWVNNIWFQDPDETKYLWTNGFKTDGDVIIVKAKSSITYEAPESLINRRVGSIRGFRFKGIDELVAANKIGRQDASSLNQSFKMLLNSRVDAVIAPLSAALFTMRQHNLQTLLRVEPVFHSVYERKFLILQDREDLQDFFNEVIAGMENDPAWHQLLTKYE